jgi:hypothetical protein
MIDHLMWLAAACAWLLFTRTVCCVGAALTQRATSLAQVTGAKAVLDMMRSSTLRAVANPQIAPVRVAGLSRVGPHLAPSRFGPGPLVDQVQDQELGQRVEGAMEQPVKRVVAAPMRVVRQPLVAVASLEVSARCQHRVEAKAFTGKGDSQAAANAAASVDANHERMHALAKASTLLGKALVYLMVHSRTATGQCSLRWRGYCVTGGVGRHRHLTGYWLWGRGAGRAWPCWAAVYRE